jgi:hypothetical protein
VNSLKGVSSRILRKENYPEGTQKLWAAICGVRPTSRPPVAERH